MENQEEKITPTTVKGGSNGFDYNKLIKDFGISLIDDKLIERFEKVTGHKIHYLIQRKLFYAHVDLDKLLDHYESKKPIYIYTGRGPSSDSLHLGHLVPFNLTVWLQKVFNAIVVIQMSDDEKYYFKDNMTLKELKKYCFNNAKDIISCGFDIDKTYIFSNYEEGGHFYPIMCKMMKLTNINQLKHIYGLQDNDNIGKYMWSLFQSVVSFPECFEFLSKDSMCLIPMAVDQAPYFRMARDLAPRLNYHKPVLLMGKFLPSLTGVSDKMSSTGNIPPIFLNDDEQNIKKKISKAFSGGKETKELQEKYGADLDIDIAYQYLRFFEEDSDILLDIEEKYKAGKMMTGDVKKYLIGKITKLIKEHKNKLNEITDDILNLFFTSFELRNIK